MIDGVIVDGALIYQVKSMPLKSIEWLKGIDLIYPDITPLHKDARALEKVGCMHSR